LKIFAKSVLGLALVFLASTSMGQTKLRAWNIHPEGYPVTIALNQFAEQIGKVTHGRYQLEVFSNGSLGDQPKAVQMLKKGEIDVAEFSSGPLSDAVPGIKVLNLPFLFRDSGHMFRNLDGKLGDQFSANLHAAGFVVLGWYDGGSRSFYCVEPITKASDLAGKRIRVQKSEVYIEMVTLLGSEPVTVPFKEVMASLQGGKIDCAENNLPSYESTGHYTMAKNVYVTNHVVSPEALVVSVNLWSKLSDADKIAFKTAGTQSALFMRELWGKRVTQALEATTKQGSQYVRSKDSANMIRRMGPLYARYMADPKTRAELLTILSDQLN
jgi:tripartite ATP-independent transporter DctP family solute receptor